MEIVVTTGMYYIPLEHPPRIFCGDSDLGKIFFEVFFGGSNPQPPLPMPSLLRYHGTSPSGLFVVVCGQTSELKARK